MDKINRALAGVEDNMLRIVAAENRISAAETRIAAAERGTKLTLAVASPKLAGGINSASFGNIKVDGKAVAIVIFDGSSSTLVLGRNIVKSGTSPIMAELPKTTGELEVTGVTEATALIIGAAEPVVNTP